MEVEFDQFKKDYNLSNLKNEIREKAVVIKNRLKNSSKETIETIASLERSYSNFKTITDDLRDYEVIQ